MKTFLILSDSHGAKAPIVKVAPLFGENDYIVHLGDGSADLHGYLSAYPEKFRICKGNCDRSFGEDSLVIEEEGVSVFCCHGHAYGVKGGLSRLAAAAKERGCTIALYGHTHRANIETVDGVLCINPGALCSYTDASYCYLVLHRGKATPTIVPLV